jgi:wobble nucleotide-excising tRNase
VENGAWLLVGLREWDLEKKDETKMQNCDLLEVYKDRDRNELKSTVKNVKWRLFTKNEDDINNMEENGDDESEDEFLGFTFAENKNTEIDKLIADELASKGTVTNIVMDNNDWINADDI